MVAGRYPKPDGERRTRHVSAFSWVYLPTKHGVKVPPLPPGRDWAPQTAAWWAQLWASPPAVMWEPSGMSLHGLAFLYQASLTATASTGLVGIYAEMRAIEDRHGLSPKALMQLRWRIGDLGDLAAVSPIAGRPEITPARRRQLMRDIEADRA